VGEGELCLEEEVVEEIFS
jgi:hypothetical protein